MFEEKKPQRLAQAAEGRESAGGMRGVQQSTPFMVAQRRRLESAFGATFHTGVSGTTSEITQREVASEKTNNTGLPNQLKAGVESLSGMSMDHVQVHYNSSKPAQLNAHAYAQGSQIHLAPGQEKHLPHEAWHVVQQAQGRVRPTFQLMGAMVNDDNSLEREADVMGSRAVSANATPLQAMLRQVTPPMAQLVAKDGLYTQRVSMYSQAPVQMITGWGLIGGIGTAAVGLGLGAGALAASTLGLGAVAGAAVAAGGLGILGAAVGGALRRTTKNNASATPKNTPELSTKDKEKLAELRKSTNVRALGVHWDAAFTDELAGRRREPDSYRRWQLGQPGPSGELHAANGKPLAPGHYIYVVTVQNEFRYLPTKEVGKEKFDQYRTHSQLAGKQKVYAAGAFNVDEHHFVTTIDNESGHYQPPHKGHADYAAQLLKFMGFRGEFKTSAHDTVKDPKGLEYVKGQVKANARALKTWIPGTKKPGWEFGFPEVEDPELKKKLPF